MVLISVMENQDLFQTSEVDSFTDDIDSSEAKTSEKKSEEEKQSDPKKPEKPRGVSSMSSPSTRLMLKDGLDFCNGKPGLVPNCTILTFFPSFLSYRKCSIGNNLNI
jgi:hypothetical protein